MAAQDKIEQFNLQDRVLELKGQGSTQTDIALILTRELKDQGIDENISQSTVQRHLAKVKARRSEEARQVVKDYTQVAVPKDLEIIEEVQGFLLNIFRNLKKDEKTGEMVDAGIELRNRVYAAVNLARVTFDKLKNLGALTPPDDESDPANKDGKPNIESSAIPSGSNVRSITKRFGIGSGRGSAGSAS